MGGSKNFKILADISFEVEFLIFLIDNTAKPKMNIQILMTRNKKKNNICLEENNIHGYAMSNFLPTGGFKWIDSKESELE